MKIIFLTHEFFPFRGGVATYVQELADAMHRIDQDVEVWTNGSPLSGSDFSAPYSIRYVGGKASLQLFSRLAFALNLFKKRYQLDEAVPVYSSYGALFCGMLLSGFGLCTPKRFGIILHGSEILKLERGLVLNILCKRFFRKASFVGTTSHHILERLKSSCLGDGLRNTAVFTCAPPANLVKECRDRKLHAHREGPVRILTLARIHPRKGHIETARALGNLTPEVRKQVTWVIAGTGNQNYLAEVLKICHEMVVKFHLVGEVTDEELGWIYNDSDIYVMSSRSLPRSIEGFGITYLEAGLHGVPVVGYRTGGVQEAVLDGKTGILVEEGNVHALSDALQELVTDHEKRSAYGKAGREHAMTFQWDHSARGLCQTIQTCSES
ncbi:MAG: glycosyltransferase family 4 protein [Verrucomicrobiota bacterium]